MGKTVSISILLFHKEGFQGGPVVKNVSTNAEDSGSIPGSGRTPGEGNDNPLQNFSPGKSVDKRSLAGYNPQTNKKVGHDLMTKQFHEE